MSKELLQFYKNGQWALRKAWGSSIYSAVSHGESPFKGDDNASHQAKINSIAHFKENKLPTKNMKNLQTGKDELHLLMHRGIPGEEPSDINPAASGPNMLDFSNNKTVKTTHNHVSTSSQGEAEFHSAKPEAGNMDKFGHYLSYWVPISSVHGNGTSIDKDKDADAGHHLIAPGEYLIHEHHKHGY